MRLSAFFASCPARVRVVVFVGERAQRADDLQIEGRVMRKGVTIAGRSDGEIEIED
jgi:hypothetical protein